MKSIRKSLLDYDIAMLKAIANVHGIELGSKRHHEVVEQLADELARPQSVVKTLEGLTSEERGALESLIAAGGKMKTSHFTRLYGDIRPFGPGRLEREKPWRNPESPAESLWYRGLIFKSFAEVDGEFLEFFFIPQDILPSLPSAEKPVFIVEASPPPSIIREGKPTLVQDVCTFLGYLQNEEVKSFKDGSIPRRDIERLKERFLQKGTFAFLNRLCQRLNLVRMVEGQLKPNPPEAKAWLKSGLPKQILALQEAWRSDPHWNELWRVESIRCEPTGWRNDPLLARQKILGYLAECPPGRWLSIASFIEKIKEIDPDFQRPDGDYDSWYILDVASGKYLLGFEHWDEVEGALIPHIISKPLYWLGVISLGYADGEEIPSSFKITEWGATFLGLPHEREAKKSSPPMIVKHDFTVLVPSDANLYDRFQLSRFAAWRSVGETYVYRITRESLARAFRQGIEMEMILAFLRRVSRGKVPRNVLIALRSFGEKRKRAIRGKRKPVFQRRPQRAQRAQR